MNEFYKTFNLASPSKRGTPKPRLMGALGVGLCWAFGLWIGLLFLGLGPMPRGNIGSATSFWVEKVHRIGGLLEGYASHHGGKFPTGASSTEIFQKLIDLDHEVDGSLFYLPLQGKIPPLPGQKLKPENVSFDITAGIDADSPPGVPIVFMTGYRVMYTPGGVATPLTKPYPKYSYNYTWEEWYYGRHKAPAGIAVAYPSLNSLFLPLKENGTVPLVQADFDPQGRTWLQLTPEGVLAP